jgi:hypothetical protein
MADASTAVSNTAPPKLDDLMLAIVDTLRHDQRLVERELSAAASDEALIKRLREVYKSQGIEVADQVLEDASRHSMKNAFPTNRLARALPAALHSHGLNERGSARSCSGLEAALRSASEEAACCASSV